MTERDEHEPAAPDRAATGDRSRDDLIEALAHGRRDLAGADAARLEDLLAEDIERRKDGSRELSVALKRAVPSADVDDLVAMALAKADTPAPSRRSLRIGALLGTLALATSATLSVVLDGGRTLGAAAGLVRTTLTLGGALERAVLALPGQANALSIALAAVLFVLAVGLRAIARGRATGAAIVPFVLAATLGTGTAHAYELEGTCGGTPVSISIDRAPRSVALRQALASGGLGLAYTLPDDPPVTLHVGRAPLSHVLGAILGSAPVRVRCSGSIVAVEPSAIGGPAIAPRPTAFAAPPLAGGAPLRDVMTFGGDALVAAIDDVRSVVTMGGDARVAGRAYGDVVTMGGDAEISGMVVGDVLTMGGDIRVTPNGTVHGRLDAMGGAIRDERLVRAPPPPPPFAPALAMMGAPPPAALPTEDPLGIADFLGSAARHALLFLLGLFFLAVAPGRLRTIGHVLVDRPARSTIAGVLSLVGTPVLCIALAITVIGIPAAAVVAVLGVIATLAGLVAASMVIGAAIPARVLSGRPVAQLAAGTLAIFLVSRLPFVGGLGWGLALAAGFGAIVLTRGGARELGRG